MNKSTCDLEEQGEENVDSACKSHDETAPSVPAAAVNDAPPADDDNAHVPAAKAPVSTHDEQDAVDGAGSVQNFETDHAMAPSRMAVILQLGLVDNEKAMARSIVEGRIAQDATDFPDLPQPPPDNVARILASRPIQNTSLSF